MVIIKGSPEWCLEKQIRFSGGRAFWEEGTAPAKTHPERTWNAQELGTSEAGLWDRRQKSGEDGEVGEETRSGGRVPVMV